VRPGGGGIHRAAQDQPGDGLIRRRPQAAARRALVALAGVALLAAGAPGFAESRETLGPGDAIRVTVFQNPDLATEARVSERGTILFPLIGEVALVGQTPAGAAARIAEQLQQGKFLINPQVNVAVTQLRSRQVSVLGQVARPGRYALDDASAKLTDILALAGGISPGGDDTVTVVSARGGTKLDVDVAGMYRSGDLSPNVEVQSGDTIYVRRAPVFYVYGEVQRAGAYRLEPGMAVMQALSAGGGLTPRGTQRGLKIHRRMPDGTLRELDAQLSDPVQPDDVIRVRESLF
jgi:polysaccharide export outer membrane protein